MLLELDEGVARRQVLLDQGAMAVDDARARLAVHRLADEDPRRTQRAPPDHHRCAAGGGYELARVGVTPHVAVADHGDADRGHHLSDDGPGGASCARLRARAE